METCRADIAYLSFYALIWVIFALSTVITSHMNMRFSRTKHTANSEFVMVFCREAETVQLVFEREQEEQIERLKADRLKRFYSFYAEQEIARIITSLFDIRTQPEQAPLSDSSSSTEVGLTTHN